MDFVVFTVESTKKMLDSCFVDVIFTFYYMDGEKTFVVDFIFQKFSISGLTCSCNPCYNTIKTRDWGTWLAQSVKHPRLNFSSGHDFRVLRLSLVSCSVLGMDPVWDSLSLCLCTPPPQLLVCALSLKKRLGIYFLSLSTWKGLNLL